MDRGLLLVAIATWLGATVLLSQIRWFRTVPLVERLRPYAPGATSSLRNRGLTAGSFRDVLGPLAHWCGALVARTLQIDDDAARRLTRIHSPVDATTFRIRQLSYSLAAALLGCATVLVSRPPVPLAGLLLLGAPALAFLVVEQHLTSQSASWRRRVFLELPVVAEQLGMLLGSGYSLGGAISRLADRGTGACGADLRRVRARIQHGTSEVAALREWAELARVDGVDRLVAVLALNHEAGDLGRLISEEARAIRRDAHRELIESIERRSQLVWIPVTVAALLPGSLFLVVPFLEAMRLFTAR